MGFYVTASIETHDSESLDKFYVRIETYGIHKHDGNVNTVLGHYKTKEGAALAMPSYVEDLHVNSGESLIGFKLTYDGAEVEHPWMHQFPLTQEETVTVTTYSSSYHNQDIEFVDFDDDGNEVIKTRQQRIETIHTGSADVVKNKVNLDLMTGSIYSYAYDKVKSEYEKIYGADNISNA